MNRLKGQRSDYVDGDTGDGIEEENENENENENWSDKACSTRELSARPIHGVVDDQSVLGSFVSDLIGLKTARVIVAGIEALRRDRIFPCTVICHQSCLK